MLYDDKKFIGKKIQEYRKKRKLTQAQLAEKVGMTDKHIGRIEAGVFFPACNKFLNILDVLQIDVSVFGLKQTNDVNINKEKALKLIFNSTDDEIDFILPVMETVSNNLTKVKKKN